MAITPRPITSNYEDTVYSFIKREEALVRRVYSDSLGIPTLGVGYAMIVRTPPGNLFPYAIRATLIQDLAAIGITWVQDSADDRLLNTLLANLNNGNGRANIGTGPNQVALAILTTDVDGNLIEHSLNSAGLNEFSFPILTDTQVRGLYDISITRARDELRAQFTKHLTQLAATDPTITNPGVAASTMFNGLDRSNEMLALSSMAFNAPGLIGSKLTAALWYGDRAESWYEIRYDSGSSHANRRYRESDQFTLYNANPTEEDYKSAYRMFTRHGDDIQFYEASYPPYRAASTSIQSQLETARNWLTSAYIDLQSIPITVDWNRIQVGETAPDPITGAGSTLYYRGTDRDILIGTHQNDLIFGESGDDYIDSKGGSDVLYGGLGDDTYIIDGRSSAAVPNTGSWIEDKQGNNTVVMNGIALDFFYRENGQIDFSSPDRRFTGRYVGTDFVVTDTQVGNNVTLNHDFTDGDFGIHLLDAPAPPTTQKTGTDSANYLDGASRLLGLGGKDMLYGTNGADLLDGGDGDDWIYGNRGADHILGGAGIDLITGFGEDSRVEGGAGNDVITAYGVEYFYTSPPFLRTDGTPYITNDAYWTDYSQYWTTNYQTGLQYDANGYLTTFSGGGVTYGIYAGASSQGGGWTYEFVIQRPGEFIIRDGLPRYGFLLSYFDPDNPLYAAPGVLSQIGGRPSPESGHTIGNQILTRGVALSGDAGDDLLGGSDGGDSLLGGSGNDSLYGNAGNDNLDGGEGLDQLAGGAGADVLTGGADDDIAYGETDSDLILGNEGNDTLWGDSYSLLLTAQDGADTLDGGAGDDHLYGQGGNDLLLGGEGNDWLQGGDGRGNDGNDALYGGAGDDILYGEDSDDVLSGGEGKDALLGGAGADILEGGAGDDNIVLDGADTLIWNVGDGQDFVEWASGANVTFGAVSYEFNGVGTGTAQVYSSTAATGQTGLLLRFSPTDSVFLANGFSDLGQTYTFGGETFSQRELLQQAGTGLALFGTADNDVIHGTEAIRSLRDFYLGGPSYNALYNPAYDDQLFGYAGADSLYGYAGNDDLDGGSGNDSLDGGDGHDRLLGQAGDDTLLGGAGNDALHGFDGNDIFDGGTGNDGLNGGDGNDTYRFGRSSGQDTIFEGQNVLTAISLDTIALDAGIAQSAVTLHRDGNNLILALDQGSTQLRVSDYFAAYAGFSESFYRIERIAFGDGTAWNDADIAARIQSGAVNAFTGSAGNDTYIVDNAQDTVTEPLNGGIDTIQSAISYSFSNPLPANVENLTLTGFLNLNALGNELNNVITGNSGNNVLEGGAGTDRMIGGAGDDLYIVDSADTYMIGAVVEAAAGGTDWVWTRTHFSLPDNVENLSVAPNFTPYFNMQLTGNSLDNLIIGDTMYGSIINGGAGADTMIGSVGTDVFYVDNPGDIIIGSPDGAIAGFDHIYSSISYTLVLGQYTLYLIGSNPISGTGTVYGDTINGMQNLAANALRGGLGDDLYVPGIGDSVVENAGEGTDTVKIDARLISGFDVTYSLAMFANVENLTLDYGAGTANLTGDNGNNRLIGNDYDNVLRGGSGDDYLSGSHGNDTLDGDTGNDALWGGYGSDRYRFARGAGADAIHESDNVGSGSVDILEFATGVLPGEVALRRVDNDLFLSTTGTTDYVRVVDYFAASSSMIEEVRFANGTIWNQTYIAANLIPTEMPTEGSNFLTGTAGDDAMNGLGGDDTLFGAAGNDVLDGGTGADRMYGGDGVDTYIVDNLGDVATETAYGLGDTVRSSVTYTLADHLENLVLTGSAAISGTGNELANTLDGSQSQCGKPRFDRRGGSQRYRQCPPSGPHRRRVFLGSVRTASNSNNADGGRSRVFARRQIFTSEILRCPRSTPPR